MKHRILQIISCFALLVSIQSLALAQSVSLPDVIAEPGQSITIPLTAENVIDLEGMDIIITFDENVIDATDVTLTGGVLQSLSYGLQKNLSVDGQVTIVLFAQIHLFSGSGVLFNLEFSVVGEPGDISPLTIAEVSINEVDVTGNAQNGSVSIPGGGFDQEVSSGWNMIGLPLSVPDSYVGTLYPSAINNTLYRFDGSYVSADSLYEGVGYWLRFSADETITIQGTTFDSVCNTVSTGWNMISGPSCDVALADVTDPEGIIIPNTFYGFDGSYIQEDTLKQGQGYWVRVADGGVLCWTCNQAAVATSEHNPPSVRSEITSRLRIADASGKSQTLFVSQEKNVQKIYYSLPPRPQPGVFDIRFQDDTRLMALNETLDIQFQGVRFPITINPIDLTGYVLVEMRGDQKLLSHPLQKDFEIVLTNEHITHLRIERIPQSQMGFDLKQNYPNPFQTTTTIQYQLPQPDQAKVRIYNVSGQLVRELTNNPTEENWQHVEWDGVNHAGQRVQNGVYFYRVSSDGFSATKRMILMR